MGSLDGSVVEGCDPVCVEAAAAVALVVRVEVETAALTVCVEVAAAFVGCVEVSSRGRVAPIPKQQ
jgi:hypothetical protein